MKSSDSFKSIGIKRIDETYAKELYKLISNSDPEYLKHFTPFEISENSIFTVLSDAVLDRYFGVFIDKALVGFYMLRGFDNGYDIPSYGVFISEAYAFLGLASLTIQRAIAFCKVNKIKRLMLKVHPDNLLAMALYESFGFKAEGTDPKNNNLIYYKDFKIRI
ncbi:MAG: GNAT family N-acetyltransferase [Bacteroidota bacterium]|nr:GNAT family N-acetyltransferase [bacterium]